MHKPLLIALAALALAAAGVAQTTWYVDAAAVPPGDGSSSAPYTSIQNAIAQRSTVDGDTLSVAPGTYHETLDFLGKAIHVVSEQGPALTIVDADDQGAVVRFVNGEGPESVLEGLRLTDGVGELLAGDPFFQLRGGGVFVDGASPTLRGCEIHGNGSLSQKLPSTDSGGGIFVRNGSPRIEGCSIQGNVCWQSGGGIEIRGASSPEILDSAIRFNSVGYGGDQLFGGGISFDGAGGGHPIVSDCVIQGNNAARGGGAYGPLEIQDTLFDGNDSVYGGGAYGATLLGCTLRGNRARTEYGHNIHACGSGGGAHASLLIGCTVEANSSCKGGGISASTAEDTLFVDNVVDDYTFGFLIDISGGAAFESTLLRCTLVGNSAAQSQFPDPYLFSGGALDACQATHCELRGNVADKAGAARNSTLLHCSVVGNVARDRTGIGGVVGGSATNSIVWGNASGDADATVVFSYSAVGGGASGPGSIDLDPKLWNPVAGDLHLTPLSPCIDAGNPASPLDPDGSVADMGVHPHDVGYQGEPRSYCEAKVNSQGCLPAIACVGTPSLSGPDDFHLIATNVRPSNVGIFFWGRAAQAVPFLGGTMCIAGPVQRRVVANSGSPGGCNGRFDRLFGQAYLANQGLVAWDTIYVQCWYRDALHPDGTGVGITDALEVTIVP